MRIKIKKSPPQNNIFIEGDKYKTLSSDGVNLLGDSHKNGGTFIASNGEVVEAERGEPVYTASNGDNFIFGNLKNPFSNKKFKNEAKELLTNKGKEEKKIDKYNENIIALDPKDKFDSLAFNANAALMDGAEARNQSYKQELDSLAQIQDSILSGMEQEKMKNGGKIKVKIKQAKDGKRLLDKGFFDQFVFNNLQPIIQPQVPTSQPLTAEQAAAMQNTMPESVRPNSQGTLAQRNNNPGNLRFNNQAGAVRGDSGFAKFNSYEEGYQALLNDIKAKQTGKTRTGLGPNSSLIDLMNVYSPAADHNDPQRLAQTLAKGFGVGVNAKIGDLDTKKLADLIAINEDAAYARQMGNTPTRVSSAQPQPSPVTTQSQVQAAPQPIEPIRTREYIAPLTTAGLPQPEVNIQAQYVNPETGSLQNEMPQYMLNSQAAQPYSAPTPIQPRRRNTLTPLDYLGEIAAIVDQPDYVQGQQYNPILMQDYRVSLQDQINQGTADFNALTRQYINNPEALATLQGQRYAQTQGVLANEFRANQEIQNRITNQNNQILNQAELTNVQLRDQQYTRMAGAEAVTDQNRLNALNSISNKYAQNRMYNNELAAQDQQYQYLSNVYQNLRPNYTTNADGTYNFNSTGDPINYGNPLLNGIPRTAAEKQFYYDQKEKKAKKQAKLDAQKASQASFGLKIKKK